MDFAPSLPAPMARMTVAAPVTASPPAYTAWREVRPSSLTMMPPFLLTSRPLVVDLISGLVDIFRGYIHFYKKLRHKTVFL